MQGHQLVERVKMAVTQRICGHGGHGSAGCLINRYGRSQVALRLEAVVD